MAFSVLCVILLLLIIISGFFSSSETGMMAVNRYKLRHLAKTNNRAAKRVLKLIERPDRLLGVILIGNTFANNLASMIAVLLAKEVLGDVGLAITVVSIGLTMVLLIFAEVGPKTIAALYPQKVAFCTSLPLAFLLRVLYPAVWFANLITNSLLQLFGVKFNKLNNEHLSRDELRTLVHESGNMISYEHQSMLLSILDLEQVAVEDVMVPRHDILGIDLSAQWNVILDILTACHYSRIPLFQDHIDNVEGMLRVRDGLNLLANEKLTRENIVEFSEPVYFVPMGTSLTTQLINFRRERLRMGLVVDEYGEVQGLVTLEDILEEIVGKFTTDTNMLAQSIHPQANGSYLVEGGVNIRELNRLMKWHFPTDGPKTLSGLITEYLQDIPKPLVSIKINDYPIEIVQVKGNIIKTARIGSRMKRKTELIHE